MNNETIKKAQIDKLASTLETDIYTLKDIKERFINRQELPI